MENEKANDAKESYKERDILGTISGGKTGIPQDGSSVSKFLTYLLYIYDSGALDPFIQYVGPGPRILLFIHYRKRCHPSQISAGLRLSRPHVASSLKTLENEGFLTRETDPSNRRQVFVTLTPKGEEVYSHINDNMVQLFAKWFKILGPETEHLMRALDITSTAIKGVFASGESLFPEGVIKDLKDGD